MPYYYSPVRKAYESAARSQDPAAQACVFCDDELLRNQSIRTTEGKCHENEHYRWIANWFPRAEAHTMLVPKRHITSLDQETDEEIIARQQLLSIAVAKLQRAYPDSGMEVFLQTGLGTESSIPHLHWHLVPAIPQHSLIGFEKCGFFTASEPNERKVVMTPITITMAREELIEFLQQF